MSVILVKLGGSVITDKTQPFTPRLKIIKHLADELVAVRQEHPDYQLVLGTGAGSYGHYLVEETGYMTNPGDPRYIAKIRRSVEELNQLVVNILIQVGIPAVALDIHKFLERRGGELHGSVMP